MGQSPKNIFPIIFPQEPANYSFEYMVKDDESGNDFGHRESRMGDRAEGRYYVLLPDGRKQVSFMLISITNSSISFVIGISYTYIPRQRLYLKWPTTENRPTDFQFVTIMENRVPTLHYLKAK